MKLDPRFLTHVSKGEHITVSTSGTNWNGYYTGNVTYSGGQSTTVNINSMVTTVSAGGGGW